MSPTPALAPLARSSVTQLVVERITSFIVESKLKPGDRLPSERDLMVQLQVGRSSLREAIMTLKALGIVESQVGEGMFVGGGDTSAFSKPLSWRVLMSEGNVREILEARKIVEVELAGLAAQRATAEQARKMGLQLEELRAESVNGNATVRSELDFHLLVAEAGNNRPLYEILDTLQRMHRAMIASDSGYTTPPAGQAAELSEELPEIYEAVKQGDPGGARAAMRRHLENVEKRLLDSLRRSHTKKGGD
jgi:GntR family transcriptional repressor for pyruvate dehydrogenase complex